jgi:hypothetical protein
LRNAEHISAYTYGLPASGTSMAPGQASPRATTDAISRARQTCSSILLARRFVGRLILTSTSSEPVNLTQQCELDCAVGISNQVIKQRPAFTMASSPRPLMLQAGTSRFPIAVTTSYFECLQPDRTLNSRFRRVQPVARLPAGSYHTVLYGSSDMALPEPAHISVVLTDWPQGSAEPPNPRLCLGTTAVLNSFAGVEWPRSASLSGLTGEHFRTAAW